MLTQEGDRLGHHATVSWPHLDGSHIIHFTTEWRAWYGLTAVRHVDAVLSGAPWGKFHSEGVVTIVANLRRHWQSIGAYTDAARLVWPEAMLGSGGGARVRQEELEVS